MDLTPLSGPNGNASPYSDTSPDSPDVEDDTALRRPSEPDSVDDGSPARPAHLAACRFTEDFRSNGPYVI